MQELLTFNQSLENLDYSIEPPTQLVLNYQSQIEVAVNRAWKNFWPEKLAQAVTEAGLNNYLASLTAKAVSILKLTKFPKWDLVMGFMHGKKNYLGYCWDDITGQVWVGLDENWLDNVANQINQNHGKISLALKKQLAFVIGEEVFHAYVRENWPDLAEENIKANATNLPEVYWKSQVELKAKEFASEFASQF